MPDGRPTIDYETPPQGARHKRRIAPYVVFWVCSLVAAFGCLLILNGSHNDAIMGVVLAVPSGLGAIVLPLLVHFRQEH
jgi:hypothetical protein